MPRDVTVTGGSRSDKQIGAVPGWADDEAIEPLGAIHWSGGSSAPCSTDFTNRVEAAAPRQEIVPPSPSI
jgi:hypothetical protein